MDHTFLYFFKVQIATLQVEQSEKFLHYDFSINVKHHLGVNLMKKLTYNSNPIV